MNMQLNRPILQPRYSNFRVNVMRYPLADIQLDDDSDSDDDVLPNCSSSKNDDTTELDQTIKRYNTTSFPPLFKKTMLYEPWYCENFKKHIEKHKKLFDTRAHSSNTNTFRSIHKIQ